MSFSSPSRVVRPSDRVTRSASRPLAEFLPPAPEDGEEAQETPKSRKRKSSISRSPPSRSCSPASSGSFEHKENFPSKSRRTVDSAQKVDVSAAGIKQTVFQLIYQGKHKLRLIKIENDVATRYFLHASDAGSILERRSNISRLLREFSSPAEKILLTVQGIHNNRIGQEANVLTKYGIYRLLELKKAKENEEYSQWLREEILTIMEEKRDSSHLMEIGKSG